MGRFVEMSHQNDSGQIEDTSIGQLIFKRLKLWEMFDQTGLYYIYILGSRLKFNSNSDDGGGETISIDIERAKDLQNTIGVT